MSVETHMIWVVLLATNAALAKDKRLRRTIRNTVQATAITAANTPKITISIDRQK
jgi:uncharacterized membrane protein